MIQETIRKHRNVFAAVVFGPIILTFIYWGGSFGGSQRQKRLQEEQRQESMVAYIGKTGIPPDAFRDQLNAAVQREARYGGKAPTYEELARQGVANKILENLVNSELLQREVQKIPLNVDRRFLVEQLKKDPMFNEKGSFDIEAWNAWIDSVSKTANWNAIYAGVAEQVRNEFLGKLVTASAQVNEADLRKQFEEEQTKLQIKYVTIEPKIEPTDEEIQAQYDKDPKVYELPEKRVAQFVAVSLKPPKPVLVDEIVTRARNGEDFAALAKEFSNAPDKDKGGQMDWRSADVEKLPPQQKVLAALEKGAVSDPIEGPNGLFIYKVEDERKNETTGEREVSARQILIQPKLTEDERNACLAKADAVAEAAQKDGNLEAAAKEAGLELQTTEPFSAESFAISPLPTDDARPFGAALATVATDELSGVISGRQALYVGKVTSVEPAVLRPLDEVRDKVVQDTIETVRNSPEYRQKVETLAEEIKAKANTIADIQETFPDLGVEPKETKEFSIKDYDYRTGPMVNPRELYQAVGHAEVGTLAGPVMDFMGRIYFVELMKKMPPDEATWTEKWPKEEEQLRKSALKVAQGERFDDYLRDLRERSDYRVNQDAVDRILGLKEAEPEEPEGTAPTSEAAPAPEATTPPEASAEGALAPESPAPSASEENAGPDQAPAAEPQSETPANPEPADNK